VIAMLLGLLRRRPRAEPATPRNHSTSSSASPRAAADITARYIAQKLGKPGTAGIVDNPRARRNARRGWSRRAPTGR